jgi:hypothetical protein
LELPVFIETRVCTRNSVEGVQHISQETKVGDITVSGELERMWKAKVLPRKIEMLEGKEVGIFASIK